MHIFAFLTVSQLFKTSYPAVTSVEDNNPAEVTHYNTISNTV